MRSTAIRWNFREYRFRFTLQFLSLQSVPLGTVSIQGFSPIPALVRGLLRLYHLQSGDLGKMTPVEGGYFATTFKCGRCYDDVVIPNHLSGSLQGGPDARMFESCLFGVRNNRQSCKNRLEIVLTRQPMRALGPFHSVP